MKKLALLLSTLFAASALAQTVPGNYTPGFSSTVNYVKNPSCITNDANITDASGIVSRTTSSPITEGLKASCLIDGTASAQVVKFVMNSFDTDLDGENCSASISYRGDASLYKAYVEAPASTKISTEVQLLDTGSTTKTQTFNFPCGVRATAKLLVLETTGASPAAIKVGNVYGGKATNIQSTQLISEWVSYTPTGSWTSNTTYTGKWRQLGDTAEVQVRLALSGAPTAASLTVNLPSGLVIDTSKLAGGTTQVELPNSDGSMRDDASYNGFVKAFYDSTTSVGIRSPSTATAHTLVIVNSTTPITWAANDSIDVTFRVPIVGWTAQTVVMPDAQGWYVDASISGANPSLGTSSVTSYTGIENGSLTMTQNSGSASAQIGCSGTNAPSGLTCSSGNESLSVAFTPPKSGTYRACVTANHYIDAPAGSINIVSTFQIVETAANAQTVLQEGKGKAMSGSVIISGDRREYRSVATCGDFVLSAGAQRMLRLMYETEITGTPDNHYIKADGDTLLGQPDVHWTVYPLQSPASAILANSVSTGTANGDKIGRATIANSGSASITSQSTGFLSSVSYVSTGVVDTFFTAGYFSAAPSCTCTARLGGRLCAIDNATPPSTSGARFWTGLANTAAEANVEFQIICVGPR